MTDDLLLLLHRNLQPSTFDPQRVACSLRSLGCTRVVCSDALFPEASELARQRQGMPGAWEPPLQKSRVIESHSTPCLQTNWERIAIYVTVPQMDFERLQLHATWGRSNKGPARVADTTGTVPLSNRMGKRSRETALALGRCGVATRAQA